VLWLSNQRPSAALVTAQARRIADRVPVRRLIPLARAWGGGDVASADGLRFVVLVRTLNAGPNPRYFGPGRGVTYLNFLSDQFAGFHAIVVPGTLRDSLYILDGLLEQQTSLDPHELMTDTAGYSDQVFASSACWATSSAHASPTSAPPGSGAPTAPPSTDPSTVSPATTSTPTSSPSTWTTCSASQAASLPAPCAPASSSASYKAADGPPRSAAPSPSSAGSPRPSTCSPTSTTRPTAGGSSPSSTAPKAATPSPAVFHGQRGQLRQRYREGQEDQLGTLGLVVNAIVLWNTRYQDAALNQLRRNGFDVLDDDIRRLSPLGHDHINLLGRYQFTAADLTCDSLRPLHDPRQPEA